MPSTFELLATIVKYDTYWDENNLEPARNLINMVLRTCHDYNDEKWDATELAGMLATLIGSWMNCVRYPEAEGVWHADWGSWSGETVIPEPLQEPLQEPLPPLTGIEE